ncbi:MAG: glyoxalase superfamily protein [Granulosicoccus sp.]
MYSHDDAKSRAKKVRTILKELGHDISHATALEVIARQFNFKDWNTCSAALQKQGMVLPIPTGWRSGGDLPDHYDIGIDQSIAYKGIHPAVIRYKHSSPIYAKGYANFIQSFDPVDYRGKRIHFSSTLKCEGCDGAVTLWLRADSNGRRAIAFDNLEDNGIGASPASNGHSQPLNLSLKPTIDNE